MANERIKLDMSIRDVTMAMAGEDHGAFATCLALLAKSEKVDPDAFGGGLSILLALDTLGIYERRIWHLYKDVCACHLGKMIAVLCAHQLGQIAGVTTQALNHAIDNPGDSIDLDAVVEAVKNRLPNFNPEATAV